MSRPPVWQLIKEAIQNLGGEATYGEIRDFIKSKYGDVNDSTITCQIIVSSVNYPREYTTPRTRNFAHAIPNTIFCSTPAVERWSCIILIRMVYGNFA